MAIDRTRTAYLYDKILFCSKKATTLTCNNMDKCEKHAELKKEAYTREHILYDSTYVSPEHRKYMMKKNQNFWSLFISVMVMFYTRQRHESMYTIC